MLEIAPGEPSVWHLLGLIHYRRGETQQGVAHLRRSVELAPGAAEFHNNLATALADAGLFDESLAHFRQALALQPGYADAHRNLAIALGKAGRLEETVDPLTETVRLRPADDEAWEELVNVYDALGQHAQALSAFRRRLAACPGPAAHSDFLLNLHYPPDQDPQSIFNEHLRWAARYARPHYPPAGTMHFDNDRSPDRPLRVGYVSGDFRDHPIGRFIAPVFSAHDLAEQVVVCYSDVRRPDAVTKHLRRQADEWHEVAGMPDEDLARRVRADRIDVLVDLTGHMGFQRLFVFARKPAPVQVSYLGYPDTTGVATIDYRITDEFHDPPGMTDRFHTERLVRLPQSCWCFDPLGDETAVSPPPADGAGHVTFGCTNRMMKVTGDAARLWAAILAATPGSRLLVLADEGTEPCVRSRLARHGVPPERVDVVSRVPRPEYLKLYHRIDVLLDTFPYNGHTTTFDALWTGVPVVTLAGQTHVSRTGLALLANLSLTELVAETPRDYVDVAVRLAADPIRLRHLRSTLRQRLKDSPLMDSRRLASSLEAAFRHMWRAWCARGDDARSHETSGARI